MYHVSRLKDCQYDMKHSVKQREIWSFLLFDEYNKLYIYIYINNKFHYTPLINSKNKFETSLW